MLQHQKQAIIGSSLIFLLVAFAACSDGGSGPTPPPPPPPAPITLTGLPTAGATLNQIALTFTVVPNAASTPGTLAITIDGTPAVTFGNQYFGTFMVSSVPLPNGVHTAHVVITPSSGGTGLDTTFSFTTEVDAKAYLSTALPPLSGFTDAVANDMNSSGVIVGTSSASSTSNRAVTWTNGVVAALPTTGGLQTDANAINTQGDIVGTLYTSPSASAALWLPGDTLQVIGTEQSGDRINDKRQVLLSIGSSRAYAALYDIATKSTTNLWTSDVYGADLNSSGQAIGFRLGIGQPPLGFATSGLSLPTTLPELNYLEPVDEVDQPVDLNDNGDILVDENGWWVLGHGSQTTFLNAFIGGPLNLPTYAARINNKGQVVALSNGGLYLWDKTTQTTQRIDAGANWTFDRISYFGDDGKILAHGTNAQGGTTAALLLTPE